MVCDFPPPPSTIVHVVESACFVSSSALSVPFISISASVHAVASNDKATINRKIFLMKPSHSLGGG